MCAPNGLYFTSKQKRAQQVCAPTHLSFYAADGDIAPY